VRILRLVRSAYRLVRCVRGKLWRMPRLVVRWIADHRRSRRSYAYKYRVSCDHDGDHHQVVNDSFLYFRCCGPDRVACNRCNQCTGDGRQRHQLLLLGSNCRHMRGLPVFRARE
jgi:hypothetical protein